VSLDKVKQPKLSDVIQQRLEELILEGSFAPGEKLPAERELALQFEVSRPSLREAIQKLEAKGLVYRRQGGGTFVADNLLESLSDPFFNLLSKNPESQLDLLEFRHGIEAMAAYYAAMRGTEQDFAIIQNKFDAIAISQIENTSLSDNNQGEAQAVFEFYLAICAASHNAVLLNLAHSMKPAIIDNINHNLQTLAKRPDVPVKVNQYRKKLLEAILSGEPSKAWGASHKHLAYIEELLIKLAQERSRVKRSLRRIS
jgi:GntR family transcriptional repressor for pyruvate dehydrogenase complex